MGNPKNVRPQDFIHLYFDDYKSGPDEDLSDEDREEIQRLIDEENARIASK